MSKTAENAAMQLSIEFGISQAAKTGVIPLAYLGIVAIQEGSTPEGTWRDIFIQVCNWSNSSAESWSLHRCSAY